MRQTLDQSVICWRAARQKKQKKNTEKQKNTADQNKHKGPFSVLPTAIRLTSETFSDIILGTDESKGERLKEKG